VDWRSGQWQTFDRFIFLVPDAQLLVVLPLSRDKLILRRCNVEEMLAKSEVDYLFVASRPVTEAAKGTEYRYPLQVWSKKGSVKAKIENGPAGMMITPEGVLTWAVPKDLMKPRSKSS